MDFSITSSGSPWGASGNNFARLRNFKAGSALSLLPKSSPASSGMGLGSDVYEAVSKQTQGLYSGGRTAAYSAKAVLGIDMSQSFKNRPAESGTEEAKSGSPDPAPA